MPKKFTSENTKSAAAKARKAAVKEQAVAKKQKEIEDALWQEDDKHILRKQQRKEEKEKKKIEQQEKKAENRALFEEEVKTLKVPKPVGAAKVTQAQIMTELEKKKVMTNGNNGSKPKPETHLDVPLEENLNRVAFDGEIAETVSEAIAVLSCKSPSVDKHPERRVKSAFMAFEELNMPRVKAENPTLRLSQLKQILRKEWLRSPENPMNQRNELSLD